MPHIRSRDTRSPRRLATAVLIALSVSTVLIAGVGTAPTAVAASAPPTTPRPPSEPQPILAIPDGKPGRTVSELPMIAAYDYQSPQFLGIFYKSFVAGGVRVHPSGAAKGKQQKLAWLYELQVYDTGGWTPVVRTNPAVAVIPKNGTLRLLPYTFFPAAQHIGKRYFRILTAMTWTRKGRTLGSRVVTHSLRGEAACATVQLYCLTGPGWVEVGS